MQMIEVGRICVKTAGRDSRRKCVVVDIVDNNFVLIDGDVRRKKCNIKHLEPLDKVIKIRKGAAHDVVVAEFKKLKLDVWSTKPKEKKERPKRIRKKKEKKVEEKPVKKAAKKSEQKEEKLAEKIEKA
ncbi:50S ribosomal protein L14e [Candidatus Woesearchaeota archaeon]|nr:50S ribosomal protein L14e [Candidatus Woesearchaeota archaeon]